MFSNNKYISGRQAFRLLTYDFLGLGTLLVPTVLAGLAERDGIFGILLGAAGILIFLKLLGYIVRDMDVDYMVYLKRRLGTFAGSAVLTGYLIYFVLIAGYTAYLFSGIVLENLLREESYFLVLALLVFLTAYGVWGGIEGRARAYEILFWFLMAPLFLMLLSSLNEIETDYWTPVFFAGFTDVLSGGYYVFQCLSLVFLVLFLKSYVEKTKTLLAAARRAVVFAGCIHAVLYLILLGIFGAAALGTMKFPAITLMSTVKISGGFLKRADAFMFAVWFFTLYALLGSTTFYGSSILFHLVGGGRGKNTGKEKGERISAVVVLAAVLVLAGTFYRNQSFCRLYERFLWYVGTPFLVLVPVVLAALIAWKRPGEKQNPYGRIRAGKRTAGEEKTTGTTSADAVRHSRKKMYLLPMVLPFVLISGCTPAELEDRSFPVEIAVDGMERFDAQWLDASKEGNRVIDYSHLKVFIIGREFLTDADEMEEFLDLLEKKSDVPRNTYVVAADSAADVMELSEGIGESVGNYLEELLENVSEVDKRAFPTLGMLYQEQENRTETLFIPYIKEADQKPAVEHYFAWRRGEAAGDVDHAAALLSFFTQNKMESYTLMSDSADVRLFSPHNTVSFSEGDAREIIVEVRCTGEILYEHEETGKSDLERQIEAYMNETARKMLAQGIDVADSYRKLGGQKREWYVEYRDDPAEYEADMQITYHVNIMWSTME